MEEKIKIIYDFYAEELTKIIKELDEQFRKQAESELLPMDAIQRIVIGPGTQSQINKQKEFTLQLASQWDGSEEEFNRIIEENFKGFLKRDANFVYFRKRHKSYEEALRLLKETFKVKLRSDNRLLKGEGKTYDEIAVSSSINKEAN